MQGGRERRAKGRGNVKERGRKWESGRQGGWEGAGRVEGL